VDVVEFTAVAVALELTDMVPSPMQDTVVDTTLVAIPAVVALEESVRVHVVTAPD
jgi:hypothetical protein